jgi:hypothetical protein
MSENISDCMKKYQDVIFEKFMVLLDNFVKDIKHEFISPKYFEEVNDYLQDYKENFNCKNNLLQFEISKNIKELIRQMVEEEFSQYYSEVKNEIKRVKDDILFNTKTNVNWGFFYQYLCNNMPVEWFKRWNELPDIYKEKIERDSKLFSIKCDDDYKYFWETRIELTNDSEFKQIVYSETIDKLKELGLKENMINNLIDYPDTLKNAYEKLIKPESEEVKKEKITKNVENVIDGVIGKEKAISTGALEDVEKILNILKVTI